VIWLARIYMGRLTSGASISAQGPLSARAFMHQLGLRRDEAAYRWYVPPAGWSAGWQVLAMVATPPAGKRGGIIQTIKAKQWVVTLAGAARDYPPTDEAGFSRLLAACPARSSVKPSSRPSRSRPSAAIGALRTGCATTSNWAAGPPAS
jgi:hypothetical protein